VSTTIKNILLSTATFSIWTLAYEYEADFDFDLSPTLTNQVIGQNKLDMTRYLKPFRNTGQIFGTEIVSLA
jgi:hypothetical protein